MDLQAAQRNQLLLTASQEKLSGSPPAGWGHCHKKSLSFPQSCVLVQVQTLSSIRLTARKPKYANPMPSQKHPKARKSYQIISNPLEKNSLCCLSCSLGVRQWESRGWDLTQRRICKRSSGTREQSSKRKSFQQGRLGFCKSVINLDESKAK